MAYGAIGGVAATFLMSVCMLLAERAGWMSELPPTRITRRTLDGLGNGAASRASVNAVSVALHLGVGGGAGAAYAVLADGPRLRRIPPLVRGVTFGTALWAMAYVGLFD